MTTRTGQCDCGQLRFTADDDPMIVHCCHCSVCQRQNGTAFALNYLIEAERVAWEGRSMLQQAETPSGRGQTLVRCPECRTTISSHYGMGPAVHFLRVGAMDDKTGIAPDVHIYTSTRQEWVQLDPATPAFDEFYPVPDFWDERTAGRFGAVMAKRQ